MDKDQFNWITFYTEFANKLVTYKDDRANLILQIKRIYDNTGLKMPLLEKDNKIVDIDPFTVFGLFNKHLTDSNRMLIITEIKSLFGIRSDVPSEFNGIPVLNNMNATFYSFIDTRGKNDIEYLWDTFIKAISYADEPTDDNRIELIEAYDKVRLLKGNKWKLTMGLYWIRPFSFINLDSRNRWFIVQPQIMPNICSSLVDGLNDIPEGKTYLDICDTFLSAMKEGKCNYHNFTELSADAWIVSEKVNAQIKNEDLEKSDNVLGDAPQNKTHYWMYAAGQGSSMWDEYYKNGIMAIGWSEIGDLTQYDSKEEMKDAMRAHIDSSLSFMNAGHATWQFANEMKPGDVVFVKRGYYEIIGRGVVKSDYRFEAGRSDGNIRDVDWTDKGSWTIKDQIVQKTLTDITQYTDYVSKLNALFDNDSDIDTEEKDVAYPAYSSEDFLKEVYMTKGNYETLVSLVRNKKNVILQGAPGVGKTFAAKRLAYSMIGEKDPSRVMMIQFHQSYSYEDFIMGFRPSESGFELKKGSFYNFCKAAEIDSENEYFFIIDEINRGNLSKIFGELFMLIENDKRGVELQLLYSDEKFSVPENVYIIGMMNTADRSLAMLDYALRRRFAFFEMKPGFETEGFREYRSDLNNPKFDRLINCIENLNSAIANDESLGEGFCIGHSYFCNLHDANDQSLSSIIEFEIIPLLKEYWFDEPVKVKDWINNLRSSIK